jgi:hypothetical protein
MRGLPFPRWRDVASMPIDKGLGILTADGSDCTAAPDYAALHPGYVLKADHAASTSTNSLPASVGTGSPASRQSST